MDKIAPTPPINLRLGPPFRSVATLATAMSAKPPTRRPPDCRAFGGSGRALTAEAMVIRVVRIDAATSVATVIKAPAAIDAATASTDTENTIAAFFSWISGTCEPADDTINHAAAIPGSTPTEAAASA